MLRVLRVAVEPELGTGDRASGQRLLHKAAGHERYLVQKHPGQRDALNEHVRTFVLAAEQVHHVYLAAALHRDNVAAAVVGDLELLLQVPDRQKRLNNVAFHRAHALSAKCKGAVVEFRHHPEYKGKGHDGGLAGTHRAVTDQGIIVAFIWEGQDLFLLRGEAHFLNSSFKLLVMGSSSTVWWKESPFLRSSMAVHLSIRVPSAVVICCRVAPSSFSGSVRAPR